MKAPRTTNMVPRRTISLVAAVMVGFMAETASSQESCTDITHVGFLVDNWCWDQPDHIGFDKSNLEFAPETHKVGCLLLTETDTTPPCVEGGYAILAPKADGSPGYELAYKLDEVGNARALAMIENSTKADDYLVRVQGTACSGVDDNVTFANLTLSESDESLVECDSFEHTGYLVDNWCWDQPDHIGFDKANLEFAPETHKVGCLLLTETDTTPPCVEGGYALLDQDENGTYYRAVLLDAVSNERALEVIKSSDKEDNFTVSVKGYVCGGEGANVTLTSIEESGVGMVMDTDMGMDTDTDTSTNTTDMNTGAQMPEDTMGGSGGGRSALSYGCVLGQGILGALVAAIMVGAGTVVVS